MTGGAIARGATALQRGEDIFLSAFDPGAVFTDFLLGAGSGGLLGAAAYGMAARAAPPSGPETVPVDVPDAPAPQAAPRTR